jgi:cytochrome c oxidase assembly factor CtaG
MSAVSAAVFSSWQVPPVVTLLLLVAGVVYLRGWRKLARLRAGRFPVWRLAAFQAGLAAVWVAVASPLDAFSGLLLTAHMAQHLLLMVAAPPLLLLGSPLLPILRGLPRTFVREGLGPFLAWPALQRFARALTHPVVGLSAMAAAMWGWHIPAAYELALAVPGWHEIEHATFLAASILFWWPVVRPWPTRAYWPAWTIPLYLLAGDLQNTALAAMLTFSDRVIYPTYAAAPRLFGLTALEDQALAGVLMWVPGSLAFLVPAAVIAARLLSPEPRTVQPARALPGVPVRRSEPFDLLRAPVVGAFLRSRWGRRSLQTICFVLAAVVVLDGLFGPPAGTASLASSLTWTWGRTLAVVALLAAGNLFCMACPFTLPRALGRRLGRAGRAFPAALRSKWVAALLLAVFVWAYEAFSLWDRPAATAALVLGYFGAAFLVESVFRGASFCKYVCPIGQFSFVGSLVSPLEVQARRLEVCASCTTHDCLRGNERTHRPGCGLDLFLPTKSGNLDCTFCLDCAKACPHDNVGLLPVVPGRELWRDPPRTSVGRLARRPDVAAVALAVVFGAFSGAAAMVEPFASWLGENGRAGTAAFFVAALAAVAGLAVGAALAGRAWSRAAAPFPEILRRQVMTLLPLALTMWAAHFVYHLATAGPTVLPAAVRAARDAGIGFFGQPDWSSAGAWLSPRALAGTELVVLDLGLLLSLYAGWRLAGELSKRPGRLFAPLACVAAALWAAGVWTLVQPMAMRGMAH